MALKLNMVENRAGAGAPAQLAAPLRGYPVDSSDPGYRHSAALDVAGLGNYSVGGWEFLLALRRLSPASRKISEFSTKRSAMAVAMVVL